MRSTQRTQKKEERTRELAYIYGVGATDGRSKGPKNQKKKFNDIYCQVAYDLGYEQAHDKVPKSSDEIIEMVERSIDGALVPQKFNLKSDRATVMNLRFEIMWDIYAIVVIGGIVFGFVLNHLYYDETFLSIVPKWLSIVVSSILSILMYCGLVNIIANRNPFKPLRKYKFDGE